MRCECTYYLWVSYSTIFYIDYKNGCVLWAAEAHVALSTAPINIHFALQSKV